MVLNDKAQFPRIIGLAGVDPMEPSNIKNLSRWFEWPMMLMAIWIILEWYMESAYGELISTRITDWAIWGFFVVETTLFAWLVQDTRRYLAGNWVNVLIVVFGCPLMWEIFPHAAGLRALRLVVMVMLFIHLSSNARRILARHNLGSTLIASFCIIIMAGTVMSVIDPNVATPLDGIWWAWVTVTTVGYGDIVPGSTAGRLFGSILILMGIGLFTMLTASFASFFMAEEEKEIKDKEQQSLQQMIEIEKRLERLEKKIDLLLTDPKNSE